jgi:hypothetical protein
MSRRRPRQPRGYVLAGVLVVLLVLGLVALMTLRQGAAARRLSPVDRDRALALGLAEVGLERAAELLTTRAAADQDFDRVLDPLGDTTCAPTPAGLALGGGRGDDHAPPFPDAATVTAGPANLRWSRLELEQGAVLVRVDDNADDNDPTLPVEFTGNTGDCVEGSAAEPSQNPVRDRDRTVVVTAVGVAAGGDPSLARATRVLEATFAPPPPAGLVARGDVVLSGASVCGAGGDVVAAGDVVGGCLCSARCSGPGRCDTDELCDAHASGDTCTATSGGTGGACLARQRVPTVPRANPWDVRNAPRSCIAPPCTPFFYLRWDGADTRLYLWNYGGVPLGDVGRCTDPAAWGRLCHPLDTEASCRGGGCWSLVSSGGGGTRARELRLVDSDALEAMTPPPMPSHPLVPVTWQTREDDAAPRNLDATCGATATPLDVWPAGTPLGWDAAPRVTFEMTSPTLPRGVWFIEGNVRWRQDVASCQEPQPKRRTVLALGDLHFERSLGLLPASRRPVAVVAGRDLRLSGPGTTVAACGPGAVLVHEQVWLDAETAVVAQLVVDNRGTCSGEVTGPAVQATSGAVIRQQHPPPLPSGPPVVRTSWRELPW